MLSRAVEDRQSEPLIARALPNDEVWSKLTEEGFDHGEPCFGVASYEEARMGPHWAYDETETEVPSAISTDGGGGTSRKGRLSAGAMFSLANRLVRTLKTRPHGRMRALRGTDASNMLTGFLICY